MAGRSTPGGRKRDQAFRSLLDEADMGPPAWANATPYPKGSQVRSGGVAYVCNSEHTSSPATEPGTGGDWATRWSAHSVFNVTDILDNFATEYPQWAAQGFEIAGYAWWQGHKDQGEPHASRYRIGGQVILPPRVSGWAEEEDRKMGGQGDGRAAQKIAGCGAKRNARNWERKEP